MVEVAEIGLGLGANRLAVAHVGGALIERVRKALTDRGLVIGARRQKPEMSLRLSGDGIDAIGGDRRAFRRGAKRPTIDGGDVERGERRGVGWRRSIGACSPAMQRRQDDEGAAPW